MRGADKNRSAERENRIGRSGKNTWQNRLGRVEVGVGTEPESLPPPGAEGYGRYSFLENNQFCRQSRASAYELRDYLITALDHSYIARPAWEVSDKLARRVIQVINGYIRAMQRLRDNQDSQES